MADSAVAANGGPGPAELCAPNHLTGGQGPKVANGGPGPAELCAPNHLTGGQGPKVAKAARPS